MKNQKNKDFTTETVVTEDPAITYEDVEEISVFEKIVFGTSLLGISIMLSVIFVTTVSVCIT